jgi:5-methylcytosine-specific restriction endonuclease McrA
LRAFEAFVNKRGRTFDLPKRAKRTPRRSREIGWRLRATVLIRDNCLCRMCGASPAKDPAVTLHVDHIVPWSKGGQTVLRNLQTLCAMCNVGKGNVGKRDRSPVLRSTTACSVRGYCRHSSKSNQ